MCFSESLDGYIHKTNAVGMDILVKLIGGLKSKIEARTHSEYIVFYYKLMYFTNWLLIRGLLEY